jgi:hypothetical protein
MNKAVGHMFLSLILFFILSGSPLWAHGDKHQEEKKEQMQMKRQFINWHSIFSGITL